MHYEKKKKKICIYIININKRSANLVFEIKLSLEFVKNIVNCNL